jgi:hypothetical protein
MKLGTLERGAWNRPVSPGGPRRIALYAFPAGLGWQQPGPDELR